MDDPTYIQLQQKQLTSIIKLIEKTIDKGGSSIHVYQRPFSENIEILQQIGCILQIHKFPSEKESSYLDITWTKESINLK